MQPVGVKVTIRGGGELLLNCKKTGLDHGVGHPMPFSPSSLLAAAD